VHNKISNLNLLTGAVELAGVTGNSSSLYPAVYDQIDPRLGFAYQVTPRFVLRGGFGITSFMDFNARLHTGNPPFHASVSENATAPSSHSGGPPSP
jgi:hypothetical protein